MTAKPAGEKKDNIPRAPAERARSGEPLIGRLYDRIALAVDRIIGWDKLPTPLGLATLLGLRNNLRRKNLYDTSQYPAVDLPPIPDPGPRFRVERSEDGSYNNLENPREGMAGSRFGRNVPPEHTFPEQDPEIMVPSPREVSRAVLTRKQFIPAPSVNVLVASWLQFMISDWFSHGKGNIDDPWRIDLASDDPWPDRPMVIPRTKRDHTRPADSLRYPATYINECTHWWDASQIYGDNLAMQRSRRTMEGGKLRLPENGSSFPENGEDPANTSGFWLGLAMLHILFAQEHNAICEQLQREYPNWSDEQLFQRGRLINSALLAKIHTVEWTPAVISHPTTVAALRANWYGVLGEQVKKLFGRVADSEVLSGIVGGETDDFGVPYTLTEEFVAVYRMHPLLPDDWSFRSNEDDSILQEATFRELAHRHSWEMLRKHSMTDLLYSFGTSHPGLVTLRNFPKFLQEYERPDGKLIDLASVDILRCRELGVPRYNEFRRLLNLAPARDFRSLSSDPATVDQLRKLYNGKIENVDLVVGMFAEKLPKGFAFSDTAFRIFVLMASRRLNSDRFLTRDYTPQVYTQTGLDWVENNSMATVLLRHYPQLRPAMSKVTNAFEPWKRSK
jgi:Animal haem peroxidase